jgi:hypothetical protein
MTRSCQRPLTSALTILLSASALLAGPVFAQAQTGETMRIESEQQARKQFEALPDTVAGPKLRSRLLKEGGSSLAAQLISAGNGIVDENNAVTPILGGPFTANLSKEKQEEIRLHNEKLVNIWNEYDKSRKGELEKLAAQIIGSDPFRSKLAQFDRDAADFNRDCNRTVPANIWAAEQAKCDRRAAALNSRQEALKNEFAALLQKGQEKVNAKFDPAMNKLSEEIKANFNMFLKLQDADKRIQKFLSVFAGLCPKAVEVKDIEALKLCAAVNWDHPDPNLPVLKTEGCTTGTPMFGKC